MLKIIDPHLHLFALRQGNYQWLKPDAPPFWPDKNIIHKDFNESDLTLCPPYQLSGFVHIEAGFDNQQPWREIDWLESHCSLPFKSVAFADITAPSFAQHIEWLSQYQSVVGVRHILDEEAYAILSSTQIEQAFAVLQSHNLSFDAQLNLSDSRAVHRLATLADKYSSLKIIINHAGFPPMQDDIEAYQGWRDNIKKLSKCGNIAIKLSGWEMSDRKWKMPHITAVIEHCLSFFGDERVMLASNFPLCTFSYTYQELWQAYASLSGLERHVLQNITVSNAAKWYKFD